MSVCDPYAYHVAFNDVFGGTQDPVDIVDMVGKTLRVLSKRRLGPLPQRLESVDFDSTEWSFEPLGRRAVGVDASVAEGEYPVYDLLRSRFRSAVGRPKLVRFDTEETYAVFREVRRKPHIDQLDARLAQLEGKVADHVSDRHGGGRVARLEQAFSEHVSSHCDDPFYTPRTGHVMRELVGAVVDAARGGKRVPLGLPPSARGQVECWLDGDEVLLSARLPSGIATTGVPVEPEFKDVVDSAEAAGCDGMEALVLGAALAPSTAGRRLLGDLSRVTPTIINEEAPFLGVLKPLADPGLAAAMALLQRCQRGDRQACREVLSMAHGDGSGLIHKASKRLHYAQEKKARQWS